MIRYVERNAQVGTRERQGDVLVFACLSPLPPPSGAELAPVGGLRSIDARWKLATLPTYLPAAQVRKALDGCDRETVMGRRHYAILLLQTERGLRADEVATLTLGDIDWRASEILVRAKGRQRARMPIPPTLARLSLHVCAMAAQSRRADGRSSAHSRHTSALLPDASR
ncbi:tyrosine-type recombinase/integrase [Bradyrhizobium sp. CW1]|uniref:tyrosine-type recombinase/integrase n=1 Tax=Bradyrhizobium sp. CW1 TaxID=2782686 RepID=UPI001FFE34B9|nr:tyrosine-type recombinase/integrase [Bradyrhizobium sp. CW1]